MDVPAQPRLDNETHRRRDDTGWHAETAAEVAGEMLSRSRADAVAWFTDWLRRRDQMHDTMAAEQLAEDLQGLSVELRSEARRESTAWTKGLIIAAAVLYDTAAEARPSL